MKILMSLILFLALAANAFAVGSVSIVKENVAVLGNKEIIILILTFTADAAAATVPDTTLTASTYEILGYQLVGSETYPGKTPPTNGYTIAIKTAGGGTLLSMTGSATASVLTNTSYSIPITGNLTFSLSGNAVNSAIGYCKLVFSASPVTTPVGSATGLALESGGNLATIQAFLTANPCADETLVASYPIYTNADLKLVTGVSAKRIYVCSLSFNTTTAQQVGIVEGTGTNCGTGTAGVIGGETDAKGYDLTDNQGVVFGNGGSWIAKTATNADDLCIWVSGSAYVRGVLKAAIK